MSTENEINAENALRHARADTDSSRAELQRLARVIAAERDKAQVVLSQKGVLESINRDLLAALKAIMQMTATSSLEACAYQGAPPKKWMRETAPALDARYTAVKEAQAIAKPAIAKAEPITS